MKVRHSEKGMALIITLLMLAIVTFMAVIFLAMSRRERGAVKNAEEQNISRMMADSAAARAQADIIATMNKGVDAYLFSPRNNQTLSTNDMRVAKDSGLIQRAKLHYSLNTSRSYVRPGGFVPGDGTNAFNVSYFVKTGPNTFSAMTYGSANYSGDFEGGS
jgi:Tfp pilus assembly protein PilX